LRHNPVGATVSGNCHKRVAIKAQDAPWEGSSYIYRLANHLPPSRGVQDTIHHTPEYPSHLLLPLTEPRS
jgi:hypothetical protein